MENLTLESLQQVLPGDMKQANDMLKRLVLTLRERLNMSNVELQKTKDQLCSACTQQKSFNQDKDYAAALAKVVSIQADYDALLHHFDTIKEKHRSTLLQMEQNRQENEKLRQRNIDLVQQLQKFQVDLSRFNELQLILTNTQLEKEKLEELQAKTYAAQLDSQNKLSRLQFDQDQLIQQLKNQIQLQQVQVLQSEKNQKENTRLKREIQEVFQITSSQSLQELQQQLKQLKTENSSKQTELEILSAKINEERLTFAAKIDLEKKKLTENLEIQNQNMLNKQRNELENIFNQQFLSQQKQISELQHSLKQNQTESDQIKLENAQMQKDKENLQKRFEQEKLIFDQAKEKAKKRNQILNEQLNQVLQEKDELEFRIDSMQKDLRQKQSDLDELRMLNKQLQRQSESVFITTKDLQGDLQPIQIQENQLQEMEFEMEKLKDVEVQQQKKIHFQVYCQNGDAKEEFAVVCGFMAEQFQSEFSKVEEGKLLIDQKMNVFVDKQFEEAVAEGLQVGLFNQNGEALHESGINLDEIITKGETEGELDLGGVIVQIIVKIE
uniref:Uncharacterized protein n=1 Tax=Trepomonas sp. PC1 TaxID=1076344 RepID=A0A146K7X1_9EUKA|eukprot:JAP92903.1 Hypothetical protein TPC1_15004 [Trepomonas sp. PC1]